jgi:response regulator of citrate/malate metabolism
MHVPCAIIFKMRFTCWIFLMQATKKLRSMGIRSMIVGVSSCTEAEKQEFMEAGLNDYQVKPLTIGVLNSILDAVKASK